MMRTAKTRHATLCLTMTRDRCTLCIFKSLCMPAFQQEWSLTAFTLAFAGAIDRSPTKPAKHEEASSRLFSQFAFQTQDV